MDARQFRGLNGRQLALLALYASATSSYSEWNGVLIEGAGPYEIEKWLRDGVGGVGGYGASSVYKWSKKLAADGFLDATTYMADEANRVSACASGGPAAATPSVGGKITVYTVTPAGHKLVQAWLSTPCSLPPIEDEAALRLFAGRYSPEETLDGLTKMRPALTTLARRLEEAAATADRSDPGQELMYDLYQSLTQARLKWLDRTERKLTKLVRERARIQKEKERARHSQLAASVQR